MNCHYSHKKGKASVVLTHIFGGILMAIAISIIFGFFVMLLWNQLMPEIFGLKAITYWQGTGLVLLSRLLFGTSGHYKHGHGGKGVPTDIEEDVSPGKDIPPTTRIY